MVVLGTCTQREQRPGSDWVKFHIDAGSKYPVKLDTKLPTIIAEADAVGGIVPCVKTSFFEDVTEFTHFDMNAAGGVVPCVKTTIAVPVITFEHFDVDAAGGIVPCVKTTVDEPLTTFELFGAGAVSGILPCVHVGAERLADGELGLIEVSVNEPELRFVVVIGSRTYRLVSGQLVEDMPR